MFFTAKSQTISATTYPFSSSTGASLEDMSSGTTQLVAADTDDGASAVTNIGFDYWFVGVRYTQFSVNANGLVRLGSTVVGTTWSNDLTTTTNVPQIAPYWDDLYTGTNGKVHFKVVGTAPNRKLVVEWQNMQIPRVGSGNVGSGTFQLWLSETTGIISFVYGNGVAANTTNSGASIGFGTSATVFASVTASASTCAYGTANNANTAAIASGTSFTFTPVVPAAATSLTFTGVSSGGMTLNWVDNATNEVAYAIYRSTDGVNYSYINSVAANSTSSVQTGLSPTTLYYWKVLAVSEGALSADLLGQQSTTACAGLAAGTYTVGPTGNYTSLTAVTAALASGTTGPVIFELQSTYVSTVESFPITFSSSACLLGSVTIRPAAGATGLSITSSNTITTIDFNTAQNVTFDGRPGGIGTTSELTISNTALGSPSAIRFINDASNNTITYCNVTGSATTSLGVISFSTGISTGNDNNTISFSNIGPAGANLPLNGIYSLGSSASVDNSGNIITNNNIFDYFSAGSVSVGINVNSFNSGWTITNNRLYQTATRTYTTANTHLGIAVYAGTGYTVSGNIIGYANSGGTGTYTMAGTIATRFTAIHLALGTGAPASNVQGNTITNLLLNTSSGATTSNGILCGINVVSGDVNVGTTTANTIGGTTGTQLLKAVSTTSGGIVVGINTASTGTVAIQSNNIGGLFSSGITAAIAGSVSGIVVSGTATSLNISNNTIGNATTDNMQGGTSGLTTGSSLVSGIWLSSSPTTVVVSGNTIQNLSSYGTGTSGFVRGIYTATTGSSVSTISQNTIKNLLTTGALTGLTSGLSAAAGIHLASGSNAVVTGNSISAIAANGTGTTNVVVAGISLAQATNTFVTKNKIWGLSNAGTGTTATAPPVVAGIALRSGTTAVTVANNMITLGVGQTTNTTFIGIWGNHGSTPDPVSNIYHNSVYISGTAASGALPSFGYVRGDLGTTARTATVDVKNNIFDNTRSGGTGQHFAISNNYGATVSTTGWAAGASNYNVLNSANASTVGYWTSALNFSGWKTSSSSDANSQSGVTVNYVNTANGDLHISGVSSVVEGTGTASATLADDFDGQVRASLTPVDIGADADNFMSYPIISLTPVSSTCTPGAVTLIATITDVDGVPTSGAGLPVLYWKINSGAYTPVTGSFIGSNQFSFTFGGGAAVGDVISYYVVAQDNLGNVGSFPSIGAGGFTSNPPAAGTPPTTPLTYSYLTTLNGNYTVGVGGNYTTLTAAAAAYNSSCLSGPVTFSLTDATYPSEVFPIVFGANSNANATNTLTIKPTVAATISGSSTGAIIQFSGSDYVTLDGSIGSTANSICPAVSATRDLTITNTNSGTGSAVIWAGSTSAGDAVTNFKVQNCVIIGNAPSTTICGIGLGGTAIGTGGVPHSDESFINNDIRSVRVGIYAVGQSATAKSQNLNVTQNIMTTASPSNIGETGVYVAFTNNVLVGSNKFDNMVRTGSPDNVAINIGMGAVNAISTTSTGITDGNSNIVVVNNSIGIVENSGTFSAAGIAVGNTISGTTLVANNMISGVRANGTAGDFAAGILLGGGTAQINVYNNTVAMQGTISGTTGASQLSACLAVTAATSGPLDIKSNIFSNTQVGNAGATLRFNAIALAYSSFAGLTASNNNYYVAGAGPGTYAVGQTGGLVSGTLQNTIANWQTATGVDANSLNVNPVYVSATDLHLSTAAGNNWCLNNAGTPSASIPPVDIDCDARSATTPDIGADEFVATGLVINNPAAVCAGGTVDLTAAAVTSGSISGLTFTYWTDAGATSALSNPSAVATSGTYYIKADNGGCTLIMPVVVTINALPTQFNVTGGGNYCSGGTGVVVGLSGSVTGVSYQLQLNSVNTGSAVAGTGSAISFGNQTGAGTYTVIATDGTTGCNNTMSGSVTVSIDPLPIITETLTEPATCVSTDGAISLVISGSSGAHTFAWTTVGGSGLNPTAQNQTGLTVGTYSVTVTNTATGCQSTESFTLNGPGGCSICPTVAGLSFNPASPVCSNANFDVSATGLTNMGVTYGITFKWAFTSLSDPYTTGNTFGTVTNGSLTGGGTTATYNTSGAPGTYYIYAILSPTPTDPACRPFASNMLTITAAPSATISYSGSPYCSSVTSATPTLTGTSGGTYSSTSGLSLNTTTGEINPSASTAGTYTVTYTVAASGGCAAYTTTAGVTITTAPSATISYAGTPYCTTVTSALPTLTGTSGGSYSSTTGLTINTATGEINPSTSTPGTYTVTYTVAAAGGCATFTTTTSVTITAMPSATISYSGTPYCTTVTSASPTISGTSGGTFASTVGLTINTSTGVINPSTSTAGTYTVTYTVAAAGGCAIYTTTANVTITAMPNASISYAGSPFCNNAAPGSPTITGTTGGSFSSTAGLSINTSTGVITPATSTPGTYTVTYTVAAAGGCAAFSTTRSVTITAVPNATLAYAGTPFCSSVTSGTPTLTGTTGGSFSSTAGLTISTSTGVINPSTSTPGTYTVTYTVAASGGCAAFSTTASVTVTAAANATISYATPICQSSTSVSPTVGGTVGTTTGTYSSTSGLSINASTGVINPSASTAGTYTVTYTVAAGGGCASYSTSTTVVINTLSVAPTGATSSSPVVCGTGNRVDLSVVGGSLGTGATWKWYTGSCGGTLIGTGATLTGVLVNSNTTFYVRAEGTCNTTACASVTVTVNTVPAVALVISPINYVNGFASVTLSAVTTPSGNYTYTWYKNNVVVAGQTASTLVVNANDAGNYRVDVNNGICSVSSITEPVVATSSDVLFVSPNPGNGQFNVRYFYNGTNAARTLVVYDSKGDRVFVKAFNVTGPYADMKVNIIEHASGLYYIALLDASNKLVAASKYYKH